MMKKSRDNSNLSRDKLTNYCVIIQSYRAISLKLSRDNLSKNIYIYCNVPYGPPYVIADAKLTAGKAL